MRNRAKCKLCGDILESFHQHDFVICKCGEISIDGGANAYKCGAKDWKNFLRVDDQGNEIVVKLEEEKPQMISQDMPKPTKKELIDMLDAMAKNIENLPQHVMSTPVNHYDLYSFMLLISQILKEDSKL